MSPQAFALYSVVLLHHDAKFLLLKRSSAKTLFPNRWTGLGGKVEAHEHSDLSASALRELHEESGLRETDIEHFSLRRVLYHNRLGGPLTGLLYYTANYAGDLPSCSEGELAWKAKHEFPALDIIETTANTLPYLAEDVRRDPTGQELVKIGVAHYQGKGTLSLISWSSLPLDTKVV